MITVSLLIMLFCIGILYKYIYKENIIWKLLLISVALGIMIIYLLPQKVWNQYKYCDSEIVKITTYGNKNEQALANEIIIMSIIIDGKYYDAPSYIISGNWNMDENIVQWNNYNSDSNFSNFIEIQLPIGYSRKIVFSSNVYRGIAEIFYRDKKIEEDFFSDTTDILNKKILEFDNGKNYSDKLLLFFKVMTMLEISLIVYFCIYYINLYCKKKLKNYNENDLIVIILLGFFTFFVLSTHSNSPWSYRIPWVDSDGFLYSGWAMKRGEKMYLDFWDHKGPYLYMIEWLGYLICNSQIGVWYIEFVVVYISLIVGYYLNKRYINKFLAFVSILFGYTYLIFYLGNGNYSETYTLPLITLAAFIFHSYFFKKRFTLHIGECIILGFMFMVAFLIKPTNTAIWFVYCLGIVVHLISIKKYKDIILYAVGFIIGMFFAFLPVAIYMTKNNIWQEFYRAYFEFNFMYVDVSWKEKIKAATYFTTNIFNGIFLIGVIMSIYKNGKKIEDLIEIICLIGWYVFSVIFVSMSGGTWGHYGIIMLPLYPIGLRIFIENFDLEILKIKKENYGYIVGIIIFIITVFIVQDDKNNFNIHQSSLWILNYSFYNDKEVKVISRKIKNSTLDDDKISVYGNEARYYLLSERKSVSRYTYQNPIASINNEIGEEYIEDIINEMPAAIIIADKEILKNEGFTYLNEKLLDILDKNYYIAYEGEKAQLYLNR